MAGTTVGKLNAILTANTSAFNTSLDKATNKATSFAGSINKTLAGIGLGISVVGFAAFVKSMMNAVEETANLAESLGVSTEGLIGLEHAATMSGSSVEELAAGLQKMVQNLGDAALQGGPTAKTLERIGLSAQELANLAPDEAFAEIAEAISKIQNPAERASTIIDIFGKSGMRLANTLMLGKEGLKAMAAEAQRLGLTFSAVDAEKVRAANDAIDRISATIKGVGQQLAIQLAPFIEAVANKFTEMATSGEGAGKKIEKALQGMIASAATAADAMQNLTIAFAAWQLIVLKAERAFFAFDALVAPQADVKKFDKEMVVQIDAQIKKLEELQQKRLVAPDWSKQLQKTIDDLKKASQEAATAAAPQPGAGAAKNFAEIGKAVTDLTEKLKMMRETIGMSQAQIDVWKLKQAGAAKATVDLANSTAQEIDRLERLIGNLTQLEGKGDFFAEFRTNLQGLQDLLDDSDISLEAYTANVNKLIDAFRKMKAAEAFKVFEETRTPLEKLQERLKLLDNLLESNAISQETYNRAIVRAINEQADAMGNLNEIMRPKAIEFGTAEAFSASLPTSRPLDMGQKLDALVEQNRRQLDLEKRQVEQLGDLHRDLQDAVPIHVGRI